MKIKVTSRGIHERMVVTADDGGKLELSELSPLQEAEMRKIGFWGVNDFLGKADAMANEVLMRHRLPTEWPLPATQSFFGKNNPAWWIPDRLDRSALNKLKPNAEFAALLRHEVLHCRSLLDHVEFRTRHLSAQTVAREYLYAGVIVGLAYWKLLSNLRFEENVGAGKRMRKAQRKATKESADKRRKITVVSYRAANKAGAKTLEQIAEHHSISVTAVQKFERKHPRIAKRRKRSVQPAAQVSGR